jgi:hypothetical protein
MNDAIKRLREALDGVMEHQWSGDKARMNALQELCFAANEVCEAPPIDVIDAARYRWLRERLLAADFDYGDPPTCAIVFRWPSWAHIGADLDSAIDEASK